MSEMIPSTPELMTATSSRYYVAGNQPTVLTNVYQQDINMVVWQRELDSSLAEAANHILDVQPALQLSVVVSPQGVGTTLVKALGEEVLTERLREDVAHIVDMFCCLFDLQSAGLRLIVLDRAMCPRFHVDHVPCRLVTTYVGVATEWLEHGLVDRSKLSGGGHAKPDEASGLFERTADIQRLSEGHVALLKGELWQGNEGGGLVHRSPSVVGDASRLLMTLDFADL